MSDPSRLGAPHGDDWLRIEWTALANDLDQQADRLEQFVVDSLRQRATYARQKVRRSQPMNEHELRLTHQRVTRSYTFAEAPTESTVDISASSDDLTAAWAELIARLPSDVYAALKSAMGVE